LPAKETDLTITEVRRLALVRAGLLKPDWTGLPKTAGRSRKSALAAALEIIRRFGYLQLDTVSIAGARSHALVLFSRLEHFDPQLGEEILQPGHPVFEYWGHEASWIPLELYPAFEFRRQEFRHHPWWGDIIGAHPELSRNLLQRIRDHGPVRSLDLEGKGSRGWWELKDARRVAAALWSSGELAIRERKGFQRTYDLAERVIPEELRRNPVPRAKSLEILLLQALQGHGWAGTGTLADTWRLRNKRSEVEGALRRLVEQGRVIPAELEVPGKRPLPGWIRPEDAELTSRLGRLRFREDRGVLLSPFDPILWDRRRVQLLFGFDQVLEIFKPAPRRTYGYYCMPVLSGERLVARVDLKAERKAGRLRVLSCRYEGEEAGRPRAGRSGAAHSAAAPKEATASALLSYAAALGLEPDRSWRPRVARRAGG
jgi:uncharacterized protein